MEGKIPQTWDEFRNLPGVGDYTAAAVFSIAFEKKYPVLDGNVNRVMSRLMAFNKPVEMGKKLFSEQLDDLIDGRYPGEFNQAMMELGSLVCRKNQPHCFECPVKIYCKAYKYGSPEAWPLKKNTNRDLIKL